MLLTRDHVKQESITWKLNEVMKDYLIRAFVCNIADALMFYFLDVRDSSCFSLKLSIPHRNSVDCSFVNRSETVMFFSLLDPSRIQKYFLSILIFMVIQLFA